VPSIYCFALPAAPTIQLQCWSKLQHNVFQPHSDYLSHLCVHMLLRCSKRGLSATLAVYALPLLFRRSISLGITSPSLATRLIRSMEPVCSDVDDSRCLAFVLRRSSRGAQENRHPGNLRIDYEMATSTSLQTAVQCTAPAMPT
jgi:hypothetical protein